MIDKVKFMQNLLHVKHFSRSVVTVRCMLHAGQEHVHVIWSGHVTCISMSPTDTCHMQDMHNLRCLY